MRRRAIVGIGIVVPLTVAGVWLAIEGNPQTVSVETPGGTIVVEVADTSAARTAGLSDRDELHGIDGLLLKWDEPGRRPIWMRRMRFPLDLIWIGAHARILAVLANVPSCSGDPCPLYEPSGTERSVAVLELSANAAARLGLAVGTTVRIPTSGRSQ